MFARGSRDGWTTWVQQAGAYSPDWPTYANHSQAEADADCLLATGRSRPPAPLILAGRNRNPRPTLVAVNGVVIP
jgi:hypothetical protein